MSCARWPRIRAGVTNAEREAIARKARRRQAVTVLRVGETVCGYAAAQLADGLPPTGHGSPDMSPIRPDEF